MLTGTASVYLPAIHFILLIYSPAVANFIKEAEPNNLMAQNDYAFMKNVYNVLGKLFDLTPPFKIEEFFSPNAAVERKISFILQLIQESGQGGLVDAPVKTCKLFAAQLSNLSGGQYT